MEGFESGDRVELLLEASGGLKVNKNGRLLGKAGVVAGHADGVAGAPLFWAAALAGQNPVGPAVRIESTDPARFDPKGEIDDTAVSWMDMYC